MSGFGSTSFGGAAFSGTGEPSPLAAIADVLSMAETLGPVRERYAAAASGAGFGLFGDGIAYLVMDDSLGASEDLAATIIKQLVERLNLTGSVLPQRTRTASLTDGLAYEEALALTWKLMLEEGVDLVGAAAATPVRVGAIADTLHALGAVSTRMDALAAISTVLAINGLLATGWRMDAIDTVEFQDALAVQLRSVAGLADAAGFGGEGAAAVRLLAFGADSLALGEELSPWLTAHESLADEILFYVTLRLDGTEYAGWVLNQGTAYEYRNYPFNGLLEFPRGSKRYYGTSDEGLFLLEGATDAGEPIETSIKTAVMDFGTGKHKRVPDVYVAVAGGTTVVLKVIVTDDNGDQVEHHYQATVPGGTKVRTGRIKVGRGLTPQFWQFALTNYEGGELELDSLKFRPLILDSRI